MGVGAGNVRTVPVEFLTDEQAEAYGTFTEAPTRPERERFFFLDDDDRDLIALRRTRRRPGGGCAIGRRMSLAAATATNSS